MGQGNRKTGSGKAGRRAMLIALAAVVIILLAAVAVLLVMVLAGKEPAPTGTPNSAAVGGSTFTYDSTVVLDDPDTLQKLVDEMVRKAEEGTMTLEMQVDAVSSDGKTFSCFLANAVENNYDMFMTLYLDETQEEIYRTGLIPLGGRIETFTLEKELGNGNHSCTLVFNQVEKDMQTIHAQVNVGLNLIVNK